MEDDYIYPPELLRTIDFEKEHLATYEPSISMLNPEPNLLVRPLQRSDYNKGKFDFFILCSCFYFKRNMVIIVMCSPMKYKNLRNKLFMLDYDYNILIFLIIVLCTCIVIF